MMEKDEYEFMPAAGVPTAEKIRKVTYQFIAVITIGCFVAMFSKSQLRDCLFLFLLWLGLITFVLFLRANTIYVAEVRIDAGKGILWFSYINYKGEQGEKSILIKQAKYSYKLRASNHYPGYTLTIKDGSAKLNIDETSSENVNQTNVFYRDQLDEMNQIILSIRAEK